MALISQLKARQVLDSRGRPTVEVELTTDTGVTTRAQVPSGASTGTFEALELRDGDQANYRGLGVLTAVKNVEVELQKLLQGKSVLDQRALDQLMLDHDGTPNKERLGANALLAVSLCAARAAAEVKKVPLFTHLRELYLSEGGKKEQILPAPLMNILNGGQHASNNIDIQEFMIVPHVAGGYARNLQVGAEIFMCLKKLFKEKNLSTGVGDEGGLAPDLDGPHEALDLILLAIEAAGYGPGIDVSLSLDVAASEFFKEGKYHFQGEVKNSAQMVEFYRELKEKYPLFSIEDGLDEEDWEGGKKLTEALGPKVMLVGDDLFVTNKVRLQRGIDKGVMNSILIKLNQIGTLTETLECIILGEQHGYSSVISHRSGETTDSFISDLAVAVGAGFIKTGSLCRSERTEKYNQLLRIEEKLLSSHGSADSLYNSIK